MKLLLTLTMCFLFFGFGYNGSNGSDGSTGSYGADGSSEVIQADGRSLVLDLTGSDAGDGTDGSAGSDASSCYQPTDRQDEYGAHGGHGGAGGDGGKGGDGGDTLIYYSKISDLKKIAIYNGAGVGGDGGEGASGGSACTCSTSSWNKEHCYEVQDCHNEQRCETREKCQTRDKCASKEVCSTRDKCRVEQKCHQEKYCVERNGRKVCGTRPKCKSVKTCSPVRSCKQVRTCKPVTTCSPERVCRDERICVPRTQCDTEYYSCTDGSDGSAGPAGSYGGSGSRGSISLVKDLKELPEQKTGAIITFMEALDGITLSKQIWEYKEGAKSLFAGKSDIDNSYSHFVRLAENTITLDWKAESSIEDFATEKITLSFNGSKVTAKFNDELFLKSSIEVNGDQTKIIIEQIFRKPEMIDLNFDFKSIKGFGKNIKMNIHDKQGITEIVDSTVKVLLIVQDKKIDLGLLTKQDLIITEDKLELELAKLKIDEHLALLADGKRVNFEILVTRKLGENSATKTFTTPKIELNEGSAIDILNRVYTDDELFNLSISEIKGSEWDLTLELKDSQRISDIVKTEIKVIMTSKRKLSGKKEIEIGQLTSSDMVMTDKKILLKIGKAYSDKYKFIEAGRKVRFFLDIKRSFKNKVVSKRISSQTVILK